MSYQGEGNQLRRAEVLRKEAHELVSCLVALGHVLARPLCGRCGRARELNAECSVCSP